MSKKINLSASGTIKFEFNLKTMVGVSKISQEKLIDYMTHDNYKLAERIMEFRSMNITSDSSILGQIDMGTPQVAVQAINDSIMMFRLENSFPDGHKIMFVHDDQVLLLYKQVSSDEHETCLAAEFVYWDDKHPPIDGLNIKTMTNVSRLTRWQLVRDLDNLERPLRGREAIIRPMSINPPFSLLEDQPEDQPEDAMDSIEGVLTDVTVFDPDDHDGMKKEPLTDRALRLPTSPLHFHLTSMPDRTTTEANGDVLIIYDKDGKNPEYIFWED